MSAKQNSFVIVANNGNWVWFWKIIVGTSIVFGESLYLCFNLDVDKKSKETSGRQCKYVVLWELLVKCVIKKKKKKTVTQPT